VDVDVTNPVPGTPDPVTRRQERRIRASAYATFAYAAFQLWVLGRHGGEWTWSLSTVPYVAVSLAAAVAMWRGSLAAAWLAGFVGAWDVWNALYMLVATLTGKAAEMGWGPGIVFSYWIIGIFGVFWLRGGIAALRLALARQRAA
jgi:hypothetical protein